METRDTPFRLGKGVYIQLQRAWSSHRAIARPRIACVRKGGGRPVSRLSTQSLASGLATYQRKIDDREDCKNGNVGDLKPSEAWGAWPVGRLGRVDSRHMAGVTAAQACELVEGRGIMRYIGTEEGCGP